MRMCEAIRRVLVTVVVGAAVAPGAFAWPAVPLTGPVLRFTTRQAVLPDLTITHIAAEPPTQEYVDIRYSYSNQGGVDALFGPNVPVRQLAMDPTAYGFPKIDRNASGSTLRAGGAVGGTMRVYLQQLPGPGSYRFTLTMDPTNQVAESNESNNSATITLQLAAAARPDAIVESVAITGQPGRPTGFNVLIRNKGQGTADFRDNSRVTTSCQIQLQNNVAVTGTLGPGQFVQKTIALYNPAYFFPIGSHTCKFTLVWNVDYTGGMIEPNQELVATNNEISFAFVVPAPDLAIHSITTNPSPVTNSPGSFRTYFLRVQVVNRGPGIHLGAASNAVGREPSQVTVFSNCAGPMPISVDLFPGATTTVELPALPNVLLPGSYTCEFRIQSQGPDADASNNVKSFSWVVR